MTLGFESGTYEGRESYRRLIERWGASWSTMVISPISLTAADEWVLAKVEYRGCPQGSEIEVRQQSWELSLRAFAEVERTSPRQP